MPPTSVFTYYKSLESNDTRDDRTKMSCVMSTELKSEKAVLSTYLSQIVLQVTYAPHMFKHHKSNI